MTERGELWVQAFVPIDGVEPVRPVITSGREPTHADEIALGALSMGDAGVGIGGAIELRPTAGDGPPARFTVVGTTMVTDNYEPRVGAGGVLHPDGLARIAPEADRRRGGPGRGRRRQGGGAGAAAGGIPRPGHTRRAPDEPAELRAPSRHPVRDRRDHRRARRGDADPCPARVHTPSAARARRVQVARLHSPPGRRCRVDRGDAARRHRPRHRHPARHDRRPLGLAGDGPAGSASPAERRSRSGSSSPRLLGVLVVANLAAAVPGWRASRIPAADALRRE